MCKLFTLLTLIVCTGYAEQPLLPLDGGEVDTIKDGVKLWSDRDYQATEWPSFLKDQIFIRSSSIDSSRAKVNNKGYVLVVATIFGGAGELGDGALVTAGFSRVDMEPFSPFIETSIAWRVYQKKVEPEDIIACDKSERDIYNGIILWREEALPIFEMTHSGKPITIPTIDISGETERHSIVARGTSKIYQGHADTVLLPDGKTIFVAWASGHAKHIGSLARSDDGGMTWSSLIKVPDNWWDVCNTPTIDYLVDPKGVGRLFVFGGGLDPMRGGKPPYPMMQAVSEDGGVTWSTMAANGVEGEVPPKSILSFENGKKLIMWSDLPGYVIQSTSYDGGLTWEKEQKIIEVPERWAQPVVIRSPDGHQLLMLMRENTHRQNSLYSISNDDSETWSKAKELPTALTGDRHVIQYAPDGRLVVVMRDRAGSGINGWQSSTYGHYVAWVGTYEDIIQGHEGQYRVKLLHSYAEWDCGYSGLEVLPDGTFVATTYVKYKPGLDKHSVVSTRFKLSELDNKLKSLKEIKGK